MFTFLRHLRQRLLAGKRFSKPASPAGRYLLYAIGEIFLVVIGILLALQVNNWNEERKQKQETKRFLASLRQDLDDDLRAIEILEREAIAYEKIVMAYRAFQNSEPADFMQIIDTLRAIRISFTPFYPIDDTYKELVSQGKLSILPETIKSRCVKLIGQFDRLKNVDRLIGDNLFPLFHNRAQMGYNEYDRHLFRPELSKDKKKMKAFIRLSHVILDENLRWKNLHLEFGRPIKEELGAIIGLIDQELSE